MEILLGVKGRTGGLGGGCSFGFCLSGCGVGFLRRLQDAASIELADRGPVEFLPGCTAL